MKHTAVNLKHFYQELTHSSGLTSTGTTFDEVLDFSPHNEVYLGEVPMFYTFSEDFTKAQDWVEIKDGFFGLIPFLIKADYHKKVILPLEAKYFVNDFYYSQIQYKKTHTVTDYAFIHFDYYQDFSSEDHISDQFKKIEYLSNSYKEVKVCFSIHARSDSKPNLSKVFLQSIQSLPKNCKIISNTELFELEDFKLRSVFLLTDEDFVLKSPWENIFAARNALVNGTLNESADEEVLRFSLNHCADKVIFHKKDSEVRLSRDIKEYLENLIQMLQSSKDLLNPNYLRLMREALSLIRSANV